jgi:hypothetical protein
MFVAACHTVIGVLVGAAVLRGIAERGFVNAMGSDPMTGYVVWFLLFGPLLALLGMSITVLEQSGQLARARPLGFAILAFTTIGVVLMPASGFWLMYPATYALLRSRAAAPHMAPAAGNARG